MNLYVGNLPYSLSEQDLEQVFAEIGSVVSAKIITDKYSGQSKGFGFIEMSSDDEAQQAISQINGKEVSGRKLIVNEAHEKKKDFNQKKDRW